MHDSEQEHRGITGCRVTYESTIFYNEANKFSMMTGRLGIVPSFSMLARYLVSIFTFSAKSFRARFFAFRASFTSAPKVSKPGQSFTFAIQHHPHTFYIA